MPEHLKAVGLHFHIAGITGAIVLTLSEFINAVFIEIRVKDMGNRLKVAIQVCMTPEQIA